MSKKALWILIGIIAVGALVRVWGLSSMDLFHDEGLYAFRSIGYFDFIDNESQTQPVQWFQNTQLPWWTRLSFHDHPPLFFLVQHFFFALLGDGRWVARLPSLLAGLGTIVLAYSIFARIFQKENVGLVAAAILAVSNIHVWISRSILIEPLLIFLLFLNWYLFLRALEDRRWWRWWGIALGLVFLTKYTGFFVVPAYGIYLLIFRRSVFRERSFYIGCALAFLFFSPVIIYNFYLYRTVGHFDLQFAYLFRQPTPEWQVSLGKFQEPFKMLLPNLFAMYSLPYLFVVIIGLVLSCVGWFKNKTSSFVLGWLFLIMSTLILVAVGSAFRFLSLYLIPFLFFSVLVYAWFEARKKSSAPLLWVVVIVLAYESFFTIQGVFVEYPDFGIAKLDAYFDEVLGNRASLATPTSLNPHLNAVMGSYYKTLPKNDKFTLLVFDENLSLTPRLWLFDRRLYYHGIPAMTAGNFKNFLKSRGAAYFHGYDIYFVKASADTSLNPLLFVPDAQDFEHFLNQELNLRPDKIIEGHGRLPGPLQPMLYVYHFAL